MSSDINVRHSDSRRRIAEQCVLLLRPSATPEQRTRIVARILKLCDYRIVTEERVTSNLLAELLAIHAQCVLDQQGKCTLTVFMQPLAWELNRALGLANDEDKGFRRVDEMCAAQPLGAERFDLSEDRLLDAVYDILQINLRLLKNGSLEHEDHEAYFKQHVAILKELMGRDKVVEPGGIAQSPDGKE
jgi:hypothetical protein